MNCNADVWITGLGAISPLGGDVASLWRALLEGRDGMGPIDRFPLGGIACTRGGQITSAPAFPADAAPGTVRSDPVFAFAVAAAGEALAQSGVLDAAAAAQSGIGLATASNFGAAHGATRLLLPGSICHEREEDAALCQGAVADALSSHWRLDGPRGAISLSCGAGAAALAWAAGLIRRRRASTMLVIGFDSLSPFSWYGLCALRTMTADCVRPFDRRRSGTLFSEGAAALVLEAADVAARRGARPLAHLRGWAVNNNAWHLTAPAPGGTGTAAVLREALRDAAVDAGDVDHFNAHGTGTKANDLTEGAALAETFGARVADLPVTAVKGSLGHMMGAAGAVEAIISVLSLMHATIPPTINSEEPDPECPVRLVTREPLSMSLRTVLSNSAGIGGNNAALVLTQP